jgi:hypothetical protein
MTREMRRIIVEFLVLAGALAWRGRRPCDRGRSGTAPVLKETDIKMQ